MLKVIRVITYVGFESELCEQLKKSQTDGIFPIMSSARMTIETTVYPDDNQNIKDALNTRYNYPHGARVVEVI
jgi:hypothetical protein